MRIKYRLPLSPITLLVLLLPLLYGGYRIFLNTQFFRNSLAEDVIFVLGNDRLRFKADDFSIFGLSSIRFSGVELYTPPDPRHVLIPLEEMSFSPSLSLLPPTGHMKVVVKFNEEQYFTATIHRPIFDRHLFEVRMDDWHPGDWEVHFVRFPISYLIASLAKRIDPSILKNLVGDLSGDFLVEREYPYDFASTQASAEVEVEGLEFKKELFSTKLQLAKDLSFNPTQVKGEIDGETISLTEPVTLTAENGSLQMTGKIVFSPKKEFEIGISGEAEIFQIVKQIFQCPVENRHVTIKGFEQIKCF